MKMRNRAVWCEVAASVRVPVASGNGDDLAGIYPSIRVMRCLGDTDQDTAASASLSVASGNGDVSAGICPSMRATRCPGDTDQSKGSRAGIPPTVDPGPARVLHSGAFIARLYHRECVDWIAKHLTQRYKAICHLCRAFTPTEEQRKRVQP